MATIKINGVMNLLAKLRAARAQMWPTVMGVIEKYVDKMVAEARKNAPLDLGETRDSIDKEVRERSVVFFVGSAHGAIQEFGYGGKMDVPIELEEEAKKFKGYQGGDFKEFVAELREWCRRKGIDEDAAYPIAASILDKGLTPQPFFYPAYMMYKEEMIREINAALDKLFKI